MISYRDLIPGKEYYIQSYDTHIYFKGMIFIDYQTAIDMDVGYRKCVNMNFIGPTCRHLFVEEDYYYDPEKIKENSILAKQTMEQRALNIILKRLINEYFKW
jgi:hypothetical protein